MGACFDTMEIRTKSEKLLKSKFKKIQDQCRREYGTNPYNGTWTTLEGIRVINDPMPGKKWTAKKKMMIEDYLEEKAQKWEFALAVKANGCYIVGGWLAM